MAGVRALIELATYDGLVLILGEDVRGGQGHLLEPFFVRVYYTVVGELGGGKGPDIVTL